MTKCVDCNREIEYIILEDKVYHGSIDRKPRCLQCSNDYEDGVYVMGDW